MTKYSCLWGNEKQYIDWHSFIVNKYKTWKGLTLISKKRSGAKARPNHLLSKCRVKSNIRVKSIDVQPQYFDYGYFKINQISSIEKNEKFNFSIRIQGQEQILGVDFIKMCFHKGVDSFSLLPVDKMPGLIDEMRFGVGNARFCPFCNVRSRDVRM